MPASFDESRERRRPEPPPWEPEPLHLPLELPRMPVFHDDATPPERESRVIVIDLD